MRILDTLIGRLTLDVMLTMKRTIPQHLRDELDRKTPTELIVAIKSTLESTADRSRGIACPDKLQSMLSATIRSELSQGITGMAHQLEAFRTTPSRPRKQRLLHRRKTVLRSSKPRQNNSHPGNGASTETQLDPMPQREITRRKVRPEPLQEPLYLAFLYLALFVRGLFLSLSLMVQPSRGLSAVLIAKYHITLLDALGRTKVLDYNAFRYYQVL
ncbi:hypothetical protein B0H66DRAFT_252630 [Apodospora peruviana]|uniref:Uncharacterized protein n=1 Tax=Apodospora peruviana TaxID=516989 RepID=A0AAE0M4Z5_9PEZI|nr:hypothetical protein B0H66DRAFT_252630 [Apodospora peruviana]